MSAIKKFAYLLILTLLISPVSPIKIEKASADVAWWDTDWSNRKTITVNAAQVSGGPHTNFPVLVSLVDSDLQSTAQADGGDIAFVSDSGTQYDHDLEYYDSSTGTMVAWVEVPSISSSANTVFYMYYGNASVADQEDVSGTWNSDYQGVWHLDEASGATRNDSSSNSHHLSDVNTVTRGTGKIGYAGTFVRATPTYLQRTDANLGASFPGNAASAAVTVTSWINLSSLPSAGYNFITKGNLYFNYVGSSRKVFSLFGATNPSTASTLDSTGTWYHVAVVYNGSNVQLYLNGTTDGSSAALASFPTDASNGAFRIGTRFDAANSFDGSIDEVRIATTARSADWLATEYSNQNAPGTFITAGSEEDQDGDAPTTTASAGAYTFGQWSSSSVSVTLSCDDGAGSGCANTKYCTDTANTCDASAGTTYSSAVSVSTEGTSYIRYLSTDNNGNAESVKSSTIKIDTVAPTVSAGADTSAGQTFQKTATVEDATSGASSGTYQWSYVSGPGQVTFGSGNSLTTTIYADRNGSYVIRFYAEDNAGLSSSDTFNLSWSDNTRSGGGSSRNRSISSPSTVIINREIPSFYTTSNESLTINDGGIFFRDRDLKINLPEIEGTKKIRLSNTSDFDTYFEQDFVSEIDWDVCSSSLPWAATTCENGIYRIFVRYYDENGDLLYTLYTSIYLKQDNSVSKIEESEKYSFNIDLSFGSTHPDVKILQDMLLQLGFFPEDVVANGYFGVNTRASIQKFQCQYNIVCSGNETTTGYGRFGPQTRAQINSL